MESGSVIRATDIAITPMDTAITRTDTIDPIDTMVMALRITGTTTGTTMGIEFTATTAIITTTATRLA